MKKFFLTSSFCLNTPLHRVSLLLLLVLTFSNVNSQCVSVGVGTVTGNVNFGTSINWANPNRVTLSDDLHGDAKLDVGDVSKYLQVSDYGYVIPPGATIDGIEVRIECHQEDFTANFADASIVLTKAGVPVGADRAGTGYYDDKDYVNTYGSSTDLWGTTWTAADLMDPGFGVLYAVTRLGGAGTFYMYVDYVEVTVYFSGVGCVLPVAYNSYDVTLQPNQTVNINWTTASEANSAFFSVERSYDGESFSSIGTVAAQGTTLLESVYSFTDDQVLEGTAYYRLQLVDRDGQSQYSDVRSVTAGVKPFAVTAFPNPATDLLQLEGNIADGTARMHDLSGKLMLEQELATGTTLDVSTLAEGMYVLQVNHHGATNSQLIMIK
jgi:hypothetical protein